MITTPRPTQWIGIISIVTGTLLLLWWILLATLLPPGGSFELIDLVLTDNWVLFNLPGSAASLLLPLVLVGLYLRQVSQVGSAGFIGFLMSFLGASLFAWLQVEENLLWPILADHAPEFLAQQGPMFQDVAFSTTFLASGLLYIIGFIIFGITMIRANVLPRWAIILLIVGASLFGIGGFMILVRTVGVILLTAGLASLGYALSKVPKTPSQPVLEK